MNFYTNLVGRRCKVEDPGLPRWNGIQCEIVAVYIKTEQYTTIPMCCLRALTNGVLAQGIELRHLIGVEGPQTITPYRD